MHSLRLECFSWAGDDICRMPRNSACDIDCWITKNIAEMRTVGCISTWRLSEAIAVDSESTGMSCDCCGLSRENSVFRSFECRQPFEEAFEGVSQTKRSGASSIFEDDPRVREEFMLFVQGEQGRHRAGGWTSLVVACRRLSPNVSVGACNSSFTFKERMR